MLRDIRWRIAIPFVALILIVMGGLVLDINRKGRETQIQILEDSLFVEVRGLADLARPFFVGDAIEGSGELARR